MDSSTRDRVNVIDTGRIIARYQPASDDRMIVISFAHVTKWKVLWGGEFFQKNNIPVIGITDYLMSWYPEQEMDRVIEAVSPILCRYKSVVTYGHSMGAYAAMRYGKNVGANLALSFSPQHSIAPEDVRGFDALRAQEHYREDLHSGMKIKAENLPERALVFFDKRHETDRKHVARLPKDKRISLIHCYKAGHQTVEMLTKAKMTSKLFKLARDGKAGQLRVQALVWEAFLRGRLTK